MKVVQTILTACSLLVLTTGVSPAQEMPKPGEQHAWLQQFVGEWNTNTNTYMEPGKPPIQSKGSETIRPLGGFWTISEIKGSMMDQPFLGNLTLGYDTTKQKYVGTWIDNISGRMQQYEGAVDPSGKQMVLEGEGACPMQPGQRMKFKEVIEVKDKDSTLHTSSVQLEGGQWITVMTNEAHRKH